MRADVRAGEESGRKLSDQFHRAADFKQRHHRTGNRNNRHHQRLHKITGDHAPCAAEQRNHQHHNPRDPQRQRDVMMEYRAGKHRQTVQPYPRAENAQRNDHPGEKLFITFAEAMINRLCCRINTQLAEAGGEPPPGNQITKHVTGEHADHVETVAVSLTGRAGKGPGAELDHKGGRADHPPEHSPAATEIVT